MFPFFLANQCYDYDLECLAAVGRDFGLPIGGGGPVGGFGGYGGGYPVGGGGYGGGYPVGGGYGGYPPAGKLAGLLPRLLPAFAFNPFLYVTLIYTFYCTFWPLLHPCNPSPPPPHPLLKIIQRRLSLVSSCSYSIVAPVYVGCLSNKMAKASKRFFCGQMCGGHSFCDFVFLRIFQRWSGSGLEPRTFLSN